MKKAIIAGAGFAGATVARKLAEAGYQVEIFERRNQIGGNAYDYLDSSKSYVHKYGPHIFRTNSKEIWDFLSRFTKWYPFMHHVLGLIDGIEVPIPFNIDSLHKVFPEQMANKLENKLIEKFGFNKKVPILELRKTDDEDLTEPLDLTRYDVRKIKDFICIM